MEVSDQFVAFSFALNNKVLAFASVYASTNLFQQKELWEELGNLQARHALPWTFLGDFNAILSAHEHSGRLDPSISHIRDFQLWTDVNQLIHVPTKCAFFTWSNKRVHPYPIERILDRVIVNHEWLSLCSSTSICTIPKLQSDHHHILLDISISVFNLVSQFRFLKVWTLHKDCRSLVEDCWMQKVWGCPLVVLGKNFKC